jgi:YHS domain-containing protein
VVLILSAVAVCSVALAADAPKDVKAEKIAAPATITSEHLNNITKMDAQGNRTALCVCGQEFQVTDKSPMILRGDETDYCHNQECHDMFLKAPKEAQEKMIGDFWTSTFPFDKMATNKFMKDGKEVATCLCGKSVDVNDKTPRVTENGVTLYLCSDACQSSLHGMSAKMRMEKEMAVAHMGLPKDAKEPMGTRK